MGKYSFMFYYDWEPYLKMLPNDAARGQFLMALLAYANRGIEFSTDDPVEQLLFAFCKNAIDRDQEKYAQRCMQNAENANKRWSNHKNANASNRIRTHATDADMDKDMDMDMDKDAESKSHPSSPAMAVEGLRTNDNADDPKQRRMPNIIITRE